MESEWFSRIAGMRRTYQNSSKQASYVEVPDGSFSVSSLMRFGKKEIFRTVKFLVIPDVPGEDVSISPGRYMPRPNPHPLPLSVFATLLYTISSVPVGDRSVIRSVIPARFRIFLNYDL